MTHSASPNRDPRTGVVPPIGGPPSAPGADAPMRLALVAWLGLPAAIPTSGTRIGGLETGAWELAKGLARHTQCHPVLVVENSRPVRQTCIDGVELYISLNRWKEMRRQFAECVDVSHGVRIRKWSWRLLWQFPLLLLSKPLRRPDPPPLDVDPRLDSVQCDAWGCFGVNADSARIIATARQRRQPAILFLESNADLDAEFLANAASTNEYGVTAEERRFCLDNAAAIVCQSHWQETRLAERFGKSGVLIRNPIRTSDWELDKPQEGGYVLWIGRYDDFHKRPLLALNIARLCPTIPFRMILNRSSPAIERRVRDSRPANVRIIDYLPFNEMPAVFQNSRVFLSTSSATHEGFPNVILQAAASGTPIVTVEDFDEFVVTSGAGYCGRGDLTETARQLEMAWTSGRPPDRQRVREHLRPFEPPTVAAQVEALAGRLLGK